MLRAATTHLPLSSDFIGHCCGKISRNVSDQYQLCCRALSLTKENVLLSEDKSKAILSLIIHRPFIWDLQKNLFQDLKTLIEQKGS